MDTNDIQTFHTPLQWTDNDKNSKKYTYKFLFMKAEKRKIDIIELAKLFYLTHSGLSFIILLLEFFLIIYILFKDNFQVTRGFIINLAFAFLWLSNSFFVQRGIKIVNKVQEQNNPELYLGVSLNNRTFPLHSLDSDPGYTSDNDDRKLEKKLKKEGIFNLLFLVPNSLASSPYLAFFKFLFLKRGLDMMFFCKDGTKNYRKRMWLVGVSYFFFNFPVVILWLIFVCHSMVGIEIIRS